MLKKKALRKIIITTFVLFIVLTICMIPSNKDKIKKEYHYINTKDVSVYLLNESDQLAKVEFKIEDKDIINVVKDIIKKLTISNDATIPNKFRQLIPKNIKLLEVLFDEGMLHLNFSKDFYNIKKDDIEKVVEAISYSLLELSSVNGVSIYVDNENISGYYSNIPEIITKEFGINKRFFIKDLSLVSKVVIYYLDNVDDNYFFFFFSKYVSDDRDKIKIIIDELSSNYIYESNLISLLDKNIKLLNYEIVSDTMIIDFNNCIYLGDDKMLEEVIYSVFANYEVNKVIIKANGEEITKKTIKVIE